jgi:hypothetical protein
MRGRGPWPCALRPRHSDRGARAAYSVDGAARCRCKNRSHDGTARVSVQGPLRGTGRLRASMRDLFGCRCDQAARCRCKGRFAGRFGFARRCEVSSVVGAIRLRGVGARLASQDGSASRVGASRLTVVGAIRLRGVGARTASQDGSASRVGASRLTVSGAIRLRGVGARLASQDGASRGSVQDELRRRGASRVGAAHFRCRCKDRFAGRIWFACRCEPTFVVSVPCQLRRRGVSGGGPTTWESTAVLGRVQVRRVAPPLQAPAATWNRPARGGREAVVVGPPVPTREESRSRSRTLHRGASPFL